MEYRCYMFDGLKGVKKLDRVSDGSAVDGKIGQLQIVGTGRNHLPSNKADGNSLGCSIMCCF